MPPASPVLDPAVRVAGVARLHGAAGQCAPCEERLGPQVRRAGLPVAAAVDDLRSAQRRVSPGRAGVRAACAVAPARDCCSRPRPASAAHAKGAHPDERATGQCHLRRGGRDGSEDPARHRGRRARRPGARATNPARIRASVDDIAKSLQSNWRAEHLFALKQALAAFDFTGTQLAECDLAVEQQLARLQVHAGDPAKGKQRGRARNAPKFDLRTQLFKMCGVDLTRIDGIDATTALAVVSETGADMSRFPTVAHFASWMGLCPGTKITGGKVLSSKTKRCANRAAQALRLAAAALRTSQSALGRTSAACARGWTNPRPSPPQPTSSRD